MIVLLMMLLVSGCQHQAIRTYDYCLVKEVTEQKVGDTVYGWIGHCDSGTHVVFSRVIQLGDGVYYSAYTENSDPALRGYIKKIEKPVK